MIRPKSREEYKSFITESFLSCINEHGEAWHKGWASSGSPKNGISGHKYRGTNAIYLSLVGAAKGYTDSRWFTPYQIMDKGLKYHAEKRWKIKKGSKAEYVEFWLPYDIESRCTISWDEYREAINNGRGIDEFGKVSRYTPVFNACDIEGVEPEKSEKKNIKPDTLIRILSENMSVPVCLDGGDESYYSVKTDTIHLPKPEYFNSEYDFDSTALHEFSHATGHEKRLNRDMSGNFSSENYAYEELVAELSSCFFSYNLPIDISASAMDNHKAYLRAWAEGIKEKPDMLFKAVREAQRANDYLERAAGLVPETEKDRGLDRDI